MNPVADRNCVVARRGGEHREAKGRSETQVNSIRSVVATSLLANGEVDVPHGHARRDGRVSELGPWLNQSMKHKLKVLLGGEGWLESERSEGTTCEAKRPEQAGRPLCRCSGVRAFIVALNPGNSGGAKGRRKVDVPTLDSLNPTQPLFPGLVSGNSNLGSES